MNLSLIRDFLFRRKKPVEDKLFQDVRPYVYDAIDTIAEAMWVDGIHPAVAYVGRSHWLNPPRSAEMYAPTYVYHSEFGSILIFCDNYQVHRLEVKRNQSQPTKGVNT